MRPRQEWDVLTKTTPVGFEPTQGDPIGLAGRRLSHSAKVSCLQTAGATKGRHKTSARRGSVLLLPMAEACEGPFVCGTI